MTNNYLPLKERIVGYFLTEYACGDGPGYVEAIAKTYLARTYTFEYVESFWQGQGKFVIEALIDERNERLERGLPCPYEYLDTDGQRVQPAVLDTLPQDIFQEALRKLSASEFERLACYLLAIIGCQSFWCTPESHDQGLDGFGFVYLPYLRDVTSEAKRVVIWVVVQAKHYESCGVCSADIRDFVGAVEISRYKVFSTKAERYPLFDLLPVSPVTMILVTSGRVLRTAHRLASGLGVILVSSDELKEALCSFWRTSGIPIPECVDSLVVALREIAHGVPVYR